MIGPKQQRMATWSSTLGNGMYFRLEVPLPIEDGELEYVLDVMKLSTKVILRSNNYPSIDAYEAARKEGGE
jgi:hypothetical protein